MIIPFWIRSFCIPGVYVLTMREPCVRPASPWRVSGDHRVLSLFSLYAWFAFSCRPSLIINPIKSVFLIKNSHFSITTSIYSSYSLFKTHLTYSLYSPSLSK